MGYSRVKKFRPLGAAILLAGIWAAAFSSFAQPSSPDSSHQSTEPVFQEITLSEEGVSAIDTAGEEWRYDFEKKVFVPNSAYAEKSPTAEETFPLSGGDEIPIEDRCTVEKKVKPFERSVWVGYEEYVDGDIIAYGRVTIKGWVKGDVKSIRKRVLVTESGRVDGNIEAPKVIVREGAIVKGEIKNVGSPLDLDDFARSFSADGVIIVLSFTATLLFFSFLVISLMPRHTENFHVCICTKKIKAFTLGFFLTLFLPALVVLVIVTVIGIFVVPFIPFIYAIAAGFGIVSFGDTLGRQFAKRYLGGEKSRLVQSTMGILLLMSLWLVVAVLLGAHDSVSQGFGIFFLVVAILVTSYPVFCGIGAALLTRFGFRDCRLTVAEKRMTGATHAPTPAPPPLPDNPPLGEQPPQ